MSTKKSKGKRLKKLIGLRSEPQGLTYGDLDEKIEKPIVCAIAEHDAKGASIAELGITCFITRGVGYEHARRAKNHAQANSWARNALRRPLREGIVERVAPGVYRMTRRGRNQVSK
jgi:hypothetical protein